MNGVGRGDNQENKGKHSLLSRETVGMTLLLFSAVIFFIAVTGKLVFGNIGIAITAFFVGLFGFYVYPLLLLCIYCSTVLVAGKRYFPARWLVKIMLLLAVVFFIVHAATAERFFGGGYGAYLSGCWSAADERTTEGTGGGIVFGLLAYPIRAVLSLAGAYVLYALLLAGMLFWIAMATPLRRYVFRSERARAPRAEQEPEPVSYSEVPVPERAATLPASNAAQPAPVYAPQSAPQPAPSPAQPAPQQTPQKQPAPARSEREERYRRSRALLFETADPSSSYRNNLIYDHDSNFNRYPRSSSVKPVEDAPAAQPAQPSPVREELPAKSVRYSENYAAGTEAGRPAMPRRITEERAAPAPSLEEDLNYPVAPSYRAPAQPMPEEHDYYANDVSVEETFSSQPNVNDYEAPARPSYEEPAAPARPTYEAPARPSYEESAAPARPTYEAPARPSYEEPAAPARASYEAPAEAPAQPAEEPLSRETFRSMFSRPVEERVRITEEPAPPAERQVPPAEEAPEEAPPAESRVFDAPMRSAADLLDDDDEVDAGDYREAMAEPEPPARALRADRGMERPLTDRPAADRGMRAAPVPADETPAPVPKKHVYKAYVRPDLNNLKTYQETANVPQEEIEQTSAVIVETLAGFRVDAEVVKVTPGSSVTRYDIDIPRNVTVSAVIKRDAEIAMRLHARDGVSIYSNSEAGAISIEVPNAKRATVGLKSVMASEEYVNGKPNSLMFAIGKDVEGRNVCGNIVKMKHLLVAGATGSGKSVCLNAMLVSLISKYSPEEMRLILIDPKKVEFAAFDGLPHLMINEIIADAQKAISALNWAIKEQERRYTLFQNKTRSGINVHNIDEYNGSLTEDEEKLPKIVIVVDELADLMSVAKKEIEERIQRLSQKARAAGIHLVIATQRPSVDVITGVIKGNLPTRLAFRVIQEVDSRTILDETGAQKLLGLGDMLYRTEGMYNSLRVQGAFVGSDEVQRIVEDIKAHNEAYFDETVAEFINREEGGGVSGGMDDADDGSVDPQYIKALAIVVKLGQASISLIQRKCSVGYNHAGKIIEWMELMGYISAFDGKAKARSVLLSKEDFEAKYGDLD